MQGEYGCNDNPQRSSSVIPNQDQDVIGYATPTPSSSVVWVMVCVCSDVCMCIQRRNV